jgi:hypothetical protein
MYIVVKTRLRGAAGHLQATDVIYSGSMELPDVC